MKYDQNPMHIWAATWQNQQGECAPSEDSDQPGHPPSLIRVSAVRMKKPWVLSYPMSTQQRLWSYWADAQADLSLQGAHSFCWFCHVAAYFVLFRHRIAMGTGNEHCSAFLSNPKNSFGVTRFCLKSWMAPFTKPIWSGPNPYQTTVRTKFGYVNGTFRYQKFGPDQSGTCFYARTTVR